MTPLPPGFQLDEEDNGLPPGFVVDVVDQGGPRSMMTSYLDIMDPAGADRRTSVRNYNQSDEVRLNRGRVSLDLTARTMLGIGPIYGALDQIDMAEKQRGKPFIPAPSKRPGGVPNPIEMLMGGSVPDAARAKKIIRGAIGSPMEGAAFSFDDELIGLIAGKAAEQRRRDEQFASRTDTPVTNFAGNVVGGAVSPANKVLMPLAGVKTAATGAKGVAQLGREGFRVGALGGGLYGAGAAEGGMEDRARGAAEGAVVGAVGGAVLGAGVGAAGNKLSTGQFFPGSSPGLLNAARQQLGISSGSISALRKMLSLSGYSGDDIDRGIVGITNRLQSAPQTGDRTGLFALELQKEFPAAQQNIQDVFQQLMTAPPRQGQTGRILTQALDDQYGSQGTFFDDVAQQRLGRSTTDMEMKILERQRRQIGDRREQVINQTNMSGRPKEWNETTDGIWPADDVRAMLADSLKDDGLRAALKVAAQKNGYRGENGLERAIAEDPMRMAVDLRTLIGKETEAQGMKGQAAKWAYNELTPLLDRASKYTRNKSGEARLDAGRDGSTPMGRTNTRFKENYSQEEAIKDARGMLQKSRDPIYEDEIASWYNALPEGEKTLVRTVWRQDLEKMLRGGKIDQDGAYLTNLRSLGLNSTLKRILGADGEAISKAIVQLSDEQKGLVSLDPRKGLQERVVRGPSADRARNLYTTNPLARIGDRIPAASQLGDIALMGTGNLPYITIARQALKAFRPSARTREGLAQLLAMRNAPVLPPPTGRLSRMPPTGLGGAPAAAQARQAPSGPAPSVSAPAVPRTSQAAPWQPAQVSTETPQIIPRVQTGAQRRADMARQKAVDAQQRAANAKARMADEETIRRTLVEAKQAEAEAAIAERQARNAAKLTKAQLAAATRAAKERLRAAKSSGKNERALATREAEAANARRQAEEGLDSALERERRLNAAAKNEASAMKDRSLADRVKQGTDERVDTYTNAQKIQVAQRNADAGIDPLKTWEETGHLALNIDGKGVVGLDFKARDSADLLRQLQRVEDDILGRNRNNPDKWSDLTLMLEKKYGLKKLEAEVRKGDVPGWRTPDERARLEQFQTGGKIAAGVAATGAAAIGGTLGYREIDRRSKAARVKAIIENPDTVKVIQRALKATKQYQGRADGRYDGDVMTGVAQFQGTYGLGKTSDPGQLDMATLEKLEEMLVFEGKLKLADEVRAIRLNKRSKEN